MTLHSFHQPSQVCTKESAAMAQLKTPVLVSIPLLLLCSSMFVMPISSSHLRSPFEEKDAPKPPRTAAPGEESSERLSDQSNYVGLGDEAGSAIAVGDFNCDRYTDLLVAVDSHRMRAVQVLLWEHHDFSFRKPNLSDNLTVHSFFSLDSISSLSPDASILAATTLDANSDGYLDVLLSLQITKDVFGGLILNGDGTGRLCFDQILPDVNPGMLIMDTNDDTSPDIFFITPTGERVFYVNDKRGTFTKKLWKPDGAAANICTPTFPFNSNAYVDLNGDCLPDLVVTTACGLEVWFNHGLHRKPVSRWMVGKQFMKKPVDFSDMTIARHGSDHYTLLDKSIWDAASGDGRATFADFNGDGTVDIAVPNAEDEELRISYNIRESHGSRKLCSTHPEWHFETDVALQNVRIPDSLFGPSRVQSSIRVGDFNFDSKVDILIINGDTGAVNLFQATQSPTNTWFPKSGMSSFVERFLFPVTGTYIFHGADSLLGVKYVRAAESSILEHIEDPLAAFFFDLNESGRQDILISQGHGTRLIWSNFKNREDAVFFKATSVETAHDDWRRPDLSKEAFSPLPGNTFQLSYGGRYGHEMHVCTQCPQSGFYALQSCSCLFGITRVANYIEEMAMGGAKGVRTWRNLMPNALAVVWPRHHQSRDYAKWKIAYLSKGRDGQMKKIVLVLFATLVVLMVAIAYTHGLERLEEHRNKLDIGYT